MGETPVTSPAVAPDAPEGEPAAQDGRLSRSARTRAAVVDALLDLNAQGNLRPTARDIATAAGVSLRTLYVHFDDLESLFLAASARHIERLGAELPAMVDEGPLPRRLEAFVGRRAFLHERGAGVRRAAEVHEPFSPALQKVMRRGRRLLRLEVEHCFRAELATCDEAGARQLATAVDLAGSSATWATLRDHQGLTVEESVEQIRQMLLAFFDRWAPEASA